MLDATASFETNPCAKSDPNAALTESSKVCTRHSIHHPSLLPNFPLHFTVFFFRPQRFSPATAACGWARKGGPRAFHFPIDHFLVALCPHYALHCNAVRAANHCGGQHRVQRYRSNLCLLGALAPIGVAGGPP